MRRLLPRRARAILCCLAAGLLALQVALACAVERLPPEARDPDWAGVSRRLRAARQGELVVVLGSSRCWMGLNDEALGPSYANAAGPGGGVLMQRIYLERLLAAGVRPRRVVLEIMPAFFTLAGTRTEEDFLRAERLCFGEMRATGSRRVAWAWLRARLASPQRDLLPCPALATRGPVMPIGLGIQPSRDEGHRQERIVATLHQYRAALASTSFDDARVRDWLALLERCRAEGIEVLAFVAPEHSRFRAATSATAALADLLDQTRRAGATVLDGRAWLDDEWFEDGHHVSIAGARQMTARFAVEVSAQAWMQ